MEKLIHSGADSEGGGKPKYKSNEGIEKQNHIYQNDKKNTTPAAAKK